MKVVRFLRTKRYPHPDGPKRRTGTVMPITDELAGQWVRAGLVELTDRQIEEIAEQRLDDFTVPELREFASQLGADLGRARTKADIRAVIDEALAERKATEAATDAPPAPGADTPSGNGDEDDPGGADTADNGGQEPQQPAGSEADGAALTD